ncbi:DNA polymerase family B-domain-containing protein [Cokeromyces recurvatus]|uniref:DNA polymerase family B-domain-containing protein n=1 Tax=Cokeromyces recurvatus TaxID=90255 RepID=UPI002220C759|nr:DNA polymerase family B-domain-containing protein [Cokeromyces recurvatus]KAI7905471.1 DNA polymerase family B-domain-containing protein [Cokeromyces recurvatus]
MSSRSERANRLKQLRESKLGKIKPRTYESEDIYDEVGKDYAEHDEEFVVDDDNAGYIDNGVDDQYFSDEYEQEPEQGKRKRRSKKDLKKKEKEALIAKPNQQINRFFNNSAMKAASKPKTLADEEQTEDFMAELLSGFGSSTKTSTTKLVSTHKLKSKNVAASTTFARSRIVLQREEEYDNIFSNEENQKYSFKPPPSPKQQAPVSVTDENMDDLDFGDDITLDDMLIDEEQLLKNKVDKMTIGDTTVKPNFTTNNKDDIKSGLQNWQAADANIVDTFHQDIVKEESQQMSIFEKDGHLKMWWYDAYERKEKGYVYLFDNNQETTEEVQISDVYSEISELFSSKKITKFASKEVTRKYAFELHDVPAESNYLKVLYDFEQPSLTGEEKGKTFSHIFGVNNGPLELFLIKRDIMGPCWLDIVDAKMSSTSETWCKAELIIEDPKKVNPVIDADGNRPTHVPPLVVMSLCLRTIMNSKKNVNEIVAASALVCDQVQIDNTTSIEKLSKARFTAVRQLDNTLYPANFTDAVLKEKSQNGFSIQVERTEASLLKFLIAKFQMYDPDIIVGHNFAGFDLDVLLHRMKDLNVQQWHRLGRLKRRYWPKLQAGAGGAGESTFQERLIMSGRLVCDTYLASKDLIRSKSYRMTDLAQSQLKIHREDIEFGKSAEYFKQTDSLIHLLKHCSFDAYLAIALMFKLQILPLTHQLTNLAGNLWSRTMTGARAERNEYLLLHEFHKAKYICPEKTFGGPKSAVVQAIEQDDDEDAVAMASTTKKKVGGRRKPAYSGGLVLEPKKGFYDKYVLLLDFNSLYPSIIQEYNICFTTVERGTFKEGEEENGEEKVPEIPDDSLPQGILPRLIKTLVDRRRQVKSLMNGNMSEADYMQLDIRQKALKLTANSMYGCLGFTHSRFYAKPLAMLITHKGREILQNTVNLANNLELNVIYGDTDSIMVYTNQDDLEEVKKMGNQLRKAVNNHYKLLEIGIDGYFKHMLLLKKKKYAALLVEEKSNGELVETIETKGLDLVRRDWCDLSHDVSTHVLHLIMSDKDREDVVAEIHAYLEVVAEQIRQGDIPLEKYVINKQLTKRPQDYADAKNQPHVQVALRMLEAGENVKSGDTVPYVICKIDEETSGDKKGSALRAYHPDMVIKNNMQLDIEWYLHQQVHPPLTRLCSPIEGTDPARLAECLGLDTKRYNIISHQGSLNEDDSEFATLDSQISDTERFKASEKLMLTCNYCGEKGILYEGIVRELDNGKLECGFDCTKCHLTIDTTSIQVQLMLAIRNYIQRYYDGWYVCDDETCNNRTRMLSVFGRRCAIENCRGLMRREVNDRKKK